MLFRSVTAMTIVGDYEFVITNTSGCKDTVKVTVPPCNCTNPDLSVTGNPAAVCAPSTIDLATIAVTDASTIVNSLTYHANATDAVSGANPLTSTVVSASGTYFIRKAGDASPCYDTVSVVITINPQPV